MKPRATLQTVLGMALTMVMTMALTMVLTMVLTTALTIVQMASPTPAAAADGSPLRPVATYSIVARDSVEETMSGLGRLKSQQEFEHSSAGRVEKNRAGLKWEVQNRAFPQLC